MVRQLPHHFTKVKISGVPFGKQRFPTGKAEAVLDLLEGLGPVPEAVRSAVMETQELEKLKVWLKLAAGAADIEEFRGKTGL